MNLKQRQPHQLYVLNSSGCIIEMKHLLACLIVSIAQLSQNVRFIIAIKPQMG